MKLLHKFTIDRATWSCGRNSWDAMLETKDGQKCCLGFLAESCGVGQGRRVGTHNPSDVGHGPGYRKLAGLLKGPDEDNEVQPFLAEKTLIEVNDDSDLADHLRERRLTDLFKKQGIGVRFVGKYPAEGK